MFYIYVVITCSCVIARLTVSCFGTSQRMGFYRYAFGWDIRTTYQLSLTDPRDKIVL